MVDSEPLEQNYYENPKLLTLSGIFLMLLSILLYLIGLYYSRKEYPEFVGSYLDSNFAAIINPLIIIAVFFITLSIILFIKTRKEHLMMLALSILAIFLWNTNSLIAANARIYDSYWHYMISQIIIDQNQFSSADISGQPFYLNYPLTGILGAELSMITNMTKENILYYYPVIFSVILIMFLYSASRLFFPESIKARAVVVLAFIIGNASLQTHFSPQTFGLLSFAFLFYIMFRYFEKPDVPVKIILIFLIFIIVIVHPLSSFILSMTMLVLVVNDYVYKKKNLSSSMILLFFIFFLAWQIYWAIKTSKHFFFHIYNTLTQIFSEGFFTTAGVEHLTYAYVDPWFIAFRTSVHIFFLIIGFIGFIIIWKIENDKWWQLLGFFGGPFLYFIFMLVSYKSFLYERTIMFTYFPLSISVGYIVKFYDVREFRASTSKSRLKFIDSAIMKTLKILKTHIVRIISVMTVLIVAMACISVIAFGLQEKAGIVPTEDIKASALISEQANGSILCIQSNALIYFYNYSSDIFQNQRDGWLYWSEAHKPVSERKIENKPPSRYIMLTKKIDDMGFDYKQTKINIENDLTLSRTYDNGFIQIYIGH